MNHSRGDHPSFRVVLNPKIKPKKIFIFMHIGPKFKIFCFLLKQRQNENKHPHGLLVDKGVQCDFCPKNRLWEGMIENRLQIFPLALWNSGTCQLRCTSNRIKIPVIFKKLIFFWAAQSLVGLQKLKPHLERKCHLCSKGGFRCICPVRVRV